MKRSLTFENGAAGAVDGSPSGLKRSKSFANLSSLCCMEEGFELRSVEGTEQRRQSRRHSQPRDIHTTAKEFLYERMKLGKGIVWDVCDGLIESSCASTATMTVGSVQGEEVGADERGGWCYNSDAESNDGGFSIGGFYIETDESDISDGSEPYSPTHSMESYGFVGGLDEEDVDLQPCSEIPQLGVQKCSSSGSTPLDAGGGKSHSHPSLFLMNLQHQFEDMHLAHRTTDGLQLAAVASG
ncbi:unnamed protein product [Discosporangium mesarthrocarpum]